MIITHYSCGNGKILADICSFHAWNGQNENRWRCWQKHYFLQKNPTEICFQDSQLSICNGLFPEICSLELQVGNGLTNCGSPGFAELVTTEMYQANPDAFCWLAPDTCPLGATIGFWIQISGYDMPSPGLITSQIYSPTDTSNITSNAFGIYYFPGRNEFSALMTLSLQPSNINFYQVYVHKTVAYNEWNHVTITFSDINGLSMSINGNQVRILK